MEERSIHWPTGHLASSSVSYLIPCLHTPSSVPGVIFIMGAGEGGSVSWGETCPRVCGGQRKVLRNEFSPSTVESGD